jgi:HEAT repeat protein
LSLTEPLDPNRWAEWWAYNRFAFFDLDGALGGPPSTGSADFWLGEGTRDQAQTSLRPTRSQIEEQVLPVFLRVLEDEDNPDLVTGCLVALGKLGEHQDPESRRLARQAIEGFLDHPSQEIRETAALSLGILADPRTIELLESLMTDGPAGQRAVGSDAVDFRTRAFAAYGLGRIGTRSPDAAVRERVVAALLSAWPEARELSTPDLNIAIVHSIGLIPLEAVAAPPNSAPPIATIPQQLALLLEFFEDERQDRLARAHVPVALGRLFNALRDKADPIAAEALQAQVTVPLVRCLNPRLRGSMEPEVRMAAALALGLFGDTDNFGVDRAIREALEEATGDPQGQVRRFAWISLARNAAREGRHEPSTSPVRNAFESELIKSLELGRGGLERWAGMAAGTYAWELRQTSARPGKALGAALTDQLSRAKALDDIAAFAVANGLYGDRRNLQLLLERLDRVSEDESRGHVAMALGLLEDARALQPLQELVDEATYRPLVLREAALALGLLGDRRASDDLVRRLADARSQAAQAALAAALGQIGDRNAIEPLLEMVEDEALTYLARAFAAVALGSICYEERRPWNADMIRSINYRALTLTLRNDAATGILDVL